jgi:crotonobetainyl-CoA:carnitine CoA-transferase CaiB-like acyl-CoA transferase
MSRLGLGYEDVRAVRPDIIYAGMFGYGQDGPYAARPAYDDLIQGAALLPFLIARAGDGTPRYVPAAIADRIVGLAAVGAINAALYHREKTGEGQRVDVPMFETMVSLTLADHLGGLTFDPPLGGGGYQRLLSPERRPYRTKDGYICALVYNDKQWRSFYAATGRAEAYDADPRLTSIKTRTEHIDALYAEVSAAFAGRTTAEWMELLEKADIPFVPLHDFESIMQDPHLKAVGFMPVVEHPSEGAIRKIQPASRWSRTQAEPHRPAPRLGEHSRELLAEAGLAKAEIDGLVASGAVQAEG